MFHELIDPKKRSNITGASRHVKIIRDSKTAFENRNFESNDCENKEAESSSTIFIPPWLRNSLGLNQRNNLSHGTGSSDVKSTKRDKELGQNEFEPLKINIEKNCCKKVTNHLTGAPQVPQNSVQEDNIFENPDNAEAFNGKNDRENPVYWNVRYKNSETDSICANMEIKSLVKGNLNTINTDVMSSAETEQLQEEEKKKFRLKKQRNKCRKQSVENQKQSDVNENSVDLLVEMKARKDNLLKNDISSEMRNHFKAKLTLMNSRSANLSRTKLNQQELRLLQDMKTHGGDVEEVERFTDHVKDNNMRDTPDTLSKNASEKNIEDVEEKSAKEGAQKWNGEKKSNKDVDSLLSTDDESDIKRFSELLNKNKNIDEKRKCLEEVRNYFERKRKLRISKRLFLEEEKSKLNQEPETKEETPKDIVNIKEVHKARKSKFSVCDEEIVEKAVNETLQKFVKMYNIHVTPVIMGNMKKNILQAMKSSSSNSHTKFIESSFVKKTDLEFLNVTDKERVLEKGEANSFREGETKEALNKELTIHKEFIERNFKTLIESAGEEVSALVKEIDSVENDNLKHLKKEFDSFLHSMQNNIEMTNLKLQSIILEKEEQAAQSKNKRLIYTFAKKDLELLGTDHGACKESLKDCEIQTTPETELIRTLTFVKVHGLEGKSHCEEGLQTEDVVRTEKSTQTNAEEGTYPQIKELKYCDINPGLYRMVKSKEVGKFYLYPEPMPDQKQGVTENYISPFAKSKKINKRRELLNLLAMEKAKERRIFFKEKEKKKLKERKKTFNAPVQPKQVPPKMEKSALKGENSVSCLYFRDFEDKNSESLLSKKGSTEENIPQMLNNSEVLESGNQGKNEATTKDHLENYWFWDGKKISPGCDLKIHVEDLLRKKLKEMINYEGRQNELMADFLDSSKNESQQSKVSPKPCESRNANVVFYFNEMRAKGNDLVFSENVCAKEINKTGKKNNEDEEEDATTTKEISTAVFEEKSVRNVATQNSELAFLSFIDSKYRVKSKMSTRFKKKFNKRCIYIKPVSGKTVNLKRAEDIIRAFEELKNAKYSHGNSAKRENSLDTESVTNMETSTSFSKNDLEDRLSMTFGTRNGLETKEISSLDFKNKFKKLISFVDREIQTTNPCQLENASCVENKSMNNVKHLELIENVLSRVNHRRKEDLWNDVRQFIKTKIGKDINCEGAREVCIEIEQDIPKNEQGKPKHPVLAKGLYCRNKGDVEVEIDLTLDDLEKILRQRQRRIRRRTLYRGSKSKKMLSSSSTQSDFTRENLRRYQRYLHRCTSARGDFTQTQNGKGF